MRITLAEDEADKIAFSIREIIRNGLMVNLIGEEQMTALDELRQKIEVAQERKTPVKKQKAIKKANTIRTNRAKSKIVNALNMMRLENRPITVYAVAKEASVSYNTAVKYADLIKA